MEVPHGLHCDDASLVSRREGRCGFALARREGLLDQDVLSAADEGLSLLRVKPVGRGDVDGIDLVGGGERLEVVEEERRAVAGAEVAGGLHVTRVGCHIRGALRLRERGHEPPR